MNSRSRFPLLFTGVPVLALSACWEETTSPTVTRVDRAGVEVVTSRAPAEGTLQVGSGDALLDLSEVGGEEYEFYRVGDVVRFGGLYVVAEPHQVRAFHPRDGLAWQFGAQGDGPREFRRITDLAPHGDWLLVFDYGRRRVTVLDRSGSWVRGFQLQVDFPGDRIATLDQGGLVIQSSFPSVLVGSDSIPLGLTRVPTAIVAVSGTGEVRETIGRTLGASSVRIETAQGIIDQRPVFGHTAHVEAWDERIAVAEGIYLGYRELDLDGRTRRIVRGDLPLELSAELLEAEWRVRTELLGPERARALRESTPLPDARPAVSRMIVGDEGEVWLKEHLGEFRGLAGQDPQPWHVFGADGVWRATAVLPAGFEPTAVVGGELLGVWRDELGVERPGVLGVARD